MSEEDPPLRFVVFSAVVFGAALTTTVLVFGSLESAQSVAISYFSTIGALALIRRFYLSDRPSIDP